MASKIIIVIAFAVAIAPAAAQDAKPGPGVDFHGDLLPRGALLQIGTHRLRPLDGVEAIKFAPNGKLLAVSGHASVVLWDVATGKQVHRFAYQAAATNMDQNLDGAPSQVVFSPDGAYLIAGNRHYAPIRIWEVSSGKEVRRLQCQGAMSVACSRDGKLLAGGYRNDICVWEMPSGKLRLKFPAHDKIICALAFSADGKRLISSAANLYASPISPDESGFYPELRIWNASTGKLLEKLPDPKTPVESLELSDDGKVLVYHDYEGLTHWNLAESKVQKRRTKLWAGTRGLAFLPGGQFAIAMDDNDNAALWDLATEMNRFPIKLRHIDECFAVSADGKTLAVAERAGAIHFYDMASGRDLLPFSGHEGAVASLAFSPDGTILASRSGDETLRFWDAATGKMQHSFPLYLHWQGNQENSVAFAPDGKLLAAGERDRIELFEPHSGKCLQQWHRNFCSFAALAISPDSSLLALGCAFKGIILLDVNTGKERHIIPPTEEDKEKFERSIIHTIVFTPDGKNVIATMEHRPHDNKQSESSLRVWDVATGKEAYRIQANREWQSSPVQAVVSPNGKIIATWTLGPFGPIRLWDRQTGKLLDELPARFGAAGALAFSPDGRYLAAGHFQDARGFPPEGNTNAVCLWEMASRSVAWQRDDHRAGIASLVFSPDGRVLASGSADTTILLRTLAPDDLDELPAQLSADMRERLWRDLLDMDAARAYQAIWTFATRPREAVTILQERLPPETEFAPQHIQKWLSQLNSDSFPIRAKATHALEELGLEVEADIRKAMTEQTTLEYRRRLQNLLTLRAKIVFSQEQLRHVRAVQILEMLHSPAARSHLERLAKGRSTAPLTQHAQAALKKAL